MKLPAFADLPLHDKGLIVAALPVVALSVAMITLALVQNQQQAAEQWVRRTFEVRSNLQTTLTLLVDAETGARGFLLTHKKEWLLPYENALKQLPQVLARLEALTQDNPAQSNRVRDLESLAAVKTQSLLALREFAQRPEHPEGIEPALVRSKAAMDAVRTALGDLQTVEDRLLAERMIQAEKARVRMYLLIAGTALFGLLGGLLGAFLFSTMIARRVDLLRANAQLLAERQPLLAVPRGADEIGSLGEAIQRADALLAEREKNLDAANEELESFSYSVSHDLRAPLRSIDGFSLALLEENADQLNFTGMQYLERVRSATQRMGQLIDDLLKLSRVTRSPIQQESVDLSRLAGDIAQELRHSDPDRQVDFTIQTGVQVNGDPGLLRVALENLIGNSWKFTKGHPVAHIQFGTQPYGQGSPVYYVRDDGAGFDQAYAGKLFGAFQRLHTTREFAGNGIGLATVQRIVHRHGGRVWAEGEVQKGATFFFTLG